jgi:phosphoglycolate phosphatase-like HAD superfamily hydrolase
MERDYRLVVFDLDNTLVDVSSVHREGYHAALRRVYGLDGATFRKTYKGNPQPVTLRSMCEEQGVPPDVIEARLPDAVRVLSEVTVSQLKEDLVPARLPGVQALLEALETESCVLGLVTGTVSGTGRAILQRAELDGYFGVTVFGDEAMSRPALMALAMEKAETVFPKDQGPGRPAVIGDSPRDIRAGRAVGGWVVAVATGAHPSDSLAEYDPDHVLEDFSDTEAALKAILG